MNRKRVQMLRDMIAGLPEERVRLAEVFTDPEWRLSSECPPEPCGAIACIAGWAWIYPPFIEAGIRNIDRSAMYAAPEFFDIPAETFSWKIGGEIGTNKEIALRRLDALLAR